MTGEGIHERVIVGDSEDWTEAEELLDNGTDQMGVFSLDEGTAVRNGSVEALNEREFHVDEIDAVKGRYLLFPSEMVSGIPENVGKATIGPEETNEANFYVGHSSGVPWFEMKHVEDYEVPGNEIPHIHDAWEFYSFHGGEATLGIAGDEYDFSVTDPASWEEREDIDYVTVEDDRVMAVPPGVPHYVEEQEQNPGLVVARYTDEGQVGRYTLDGEPANKWSEEKEVEPQGFYEALD